MKQEEPKSDWNDSVKVVSYFLGVTGLWLTAFILGRYPLYFPTFYIVVISILIIIRYYLYKKQDYHYFLFDFCYALNGLLILLIIWPSDFLFTVVFVLAHGPVAWAVFIWKNALVFHSLDKITSVCIHILPCLTIFVITWFDERYNHKLSPYYFISSFLVYALWQTVYFFIMEQKVDKLNAGERINSYTFLKKRYNLEISFKNFIFIQGIYTVLTMLPTILFYNSMIFHAFFIVYLINIATYNGALREMSRKKKHA